MHKQLQRDADSKGAAGKLQLTEAWAHPQPSPKNLQTLSGRTRTRTVLSGLSARTRTSQNYHINVKIYGVYVVA